MKWFKILTFLPLSLTLESQAAQLPSPVGLVDLGYAKHIPTSAYTTPSGRNISIYKNIRFAKPPTGNFRFRRPDTRIAKIPGIQDGKVDDEQSTHCISSMPAEAPFPPYNGTTWGTEDCLFLDVWVPDGIDPREQVPVLHWFVGSAFAFGSKEMFVSPSGLFDVMDDETNFIFVANNYRLGVSGWTYLPGEDMVANAGMHDCLAAAEWTKKYIGRFGGDAGRVTVLGQSAGAGIIGLLTVLNGGKEKLPFQQALISSPGIPPRRHPIERQKRLFQMILNEANCTSIECLRDAPESTIVRVNEKLINGMPSDAGGGVFGPAPGFGPVPDGSFVPDTPVALFQQGKFHKELRSLVVGNVANEGLGLTRDEGFPEYFPTMVRQIFSTASNEMIAEIQANYDFTGNPAKLAWDWTTDVIFACNAANIAAAYKEKARRYIFSVPPAVHGQDSLYFFYSDPTTTPVGDVEAARAAQRYLLNFLHGRNFPWPVFGEGKQITNITAAGFEHVALGEDLKARCEMINRLVMDPKSGV
ncbi:lipase 1 [Podospora aff. communis PSN243]|uniref:Carboxylic ester hydrolase n=1 Tax=Podospora aff. communis PSN243 TaxID=3040156 RepID=A0AAV9G629_9PEZI|nr:lipase 1 [Podospora aff. communis PSN243]